MASSSSHPRSPASSEDEPVAPAQSVPKRQRQNTPAAPTTEGETHQVTLPPRLQPEVEQYLRQWTAAHEKELARMRAEQAAQRAQIQMLTKEMHNVVEHLDYLTGLTDLQREDIMQLENRVAANEQSIVGILQRLNELEDPVEAPAEENEEELAGEEAQSEDEGSTSTIASAGSDE